MALAAAVTLVLRGDDVTLWGTPGGKVAGDSAQLDVQPAPSAPPLPTTGARPLGERVAVADVEVTAFTYRQPSAAGGKAPAKGYGWAALDAELCVRAGTAAGSWEPWSLIYRDGSTAVARRPAAGAGETPGFPDDGKQIAAGTCARGWIMFAVPTAERPMLVELQPRDGVANWIVPNG